MFTEWWDLKNPEEKNDVLPEVINGHNIADYIDPDIFKKLESLEKEEELREEAGFYDDDEVGWMEQLYIVVGQRGWFIAVYIYPLSVWCTSKFTAVSSNF